VNDVASILVPAFLGSLKVISDDVTEMGWGTIVHEAHVSWNIQRDTANNSGEVLQKKMTVSGIIASKRRNGLQQYQPKGRAIA
jgi:hypothetical protein